MPKLIHAITVFAITLLTTQAIATDVTGTITSEKKVKDSQKPVVIWLEGLTGGPEQKNKPLVSQSGIQFRPRVLAVSQGSTVSFPNEDDVAHNVFSLSKSKKFKLGIYPKGDTREVTFEKTGVIDLFCSIHRHMHAVIVVTPNNYYAQGMLGENFSIPEVPPGTYKIKVWNSKYKTSEYEIEVPESGDVDFSVELKKKKKK